MSFEKYIEKGGRKYRLGFTTGSAAAGAARAAAEKLFNNQTKETVVVETPSGNRLELNPVNIEADKRYARAAVIKDAGDDPDVTDGIKIYARVEIKSGSSISIEGGRGVGKVTKPGLAVAVGKAAINPVPREMINRAVREVVPEGQGVKVIIEIPRGQEIAEKTFNPDLGITGGLSVLGTTGIVEPMSESAYKESLALSLKQAVELGHKKLVLVFGNHGKKLAVNSGFNEKAVIRMSNFVGYMLDQCLQLDIDRVLMLGHIGKIVKVAGGIYNTHSKTADARREIIAACTGLYGAEQELIEKIFTANTAEEAANILLKNDLSGVFDLIAARVVTRINQRTDNRFAAASLIFSLEKGILGSHGLEKEINLNYE